MPPGTETGGMPFSLDDYPHHDGPLEAFDDPAIREIDLMWGTRLGKTTLSLSLQGKIAATNPRNMMLASPTKEAAGKVVDGRLYPLLESTRGVKEQLLPPSRRSKFEVKLKYCRIYVGWSGSETSLADVGAYFGIGSEIDKWDTSKSSEADSLLLFLNRFKGFTDHKVVLESSPTIKGLSRIEGRLLKSKRHRRYVPCPHCGGYQVLRKGDKSRPGGFRWEHNERGESDADTAFYTAYYECEHCLGKIENEHRKPMLRRGVWVPDGCSITNDGEITGTPINARSNRAGFGPLASWYSLTETWGSFAKRWIEAQGKPSELQDVVNSYMSETWEVRKTKTEPEVVGERISGQVPRGFIPPGVKFMTVTVDRQESEGGFCPWVVMGHGDDDRAWVIDYGRAVELALLWEKVIRAKFPFEDESVDGLIPGLSGVDSGWDTKNTYDFCNGHPGLVIALKGSSTDLGGKPYDLKILNQGQPNEQQLLLVNTDLWETDIHNRLEKLLHDEPGSLTLCKEARFDTKFLDQLCNGVLTDRVNRRGDPMLTWEKKDEAIPNDYRDCVRYGLCLAKVYRDLEALKVAPRTVQVPEHLMRGRYR